MSNQQNMLICRDNDALDVIREIGFGRLVDRPRHVARGFRRSRDSGYPPDPRSSAMTQMNLPFGPDEDGGRAPMFVTIAEAAVLVRVCERTARQDC
jgi:hypothetical protein